MRLGLITGIVAHRPRKMPRVAEYAGAARNKQLRHLVVIAILPDRRVASRAERLEQKRDVLLLHESPHLLDCLRRAIAVVETDEVDLASVHPALVVDHLEIGQFRPADHSVGGGGTAVGHGLPDLDFGVGDARRVFSARGSESLSGICGGRSGRLQKEATRDHVIPPSMQFLVLTPRLGKITRAGHAAP